MAGYVPITIDPGGDFIKAFSTGFQLGERLRGMDAKEAVGKATGEAYTLMSNIRDGVEKATPETQGKINELLGVALAAAPEAGMDQKELTQLIPPLNQVILQNLRTFHETMIANPGSQEALNAATAGVQLLSGGPPGQAQYGEDGETMVVVPGNAESEEDVVVLEPQQVQQMGETLNSDEAYPIIEQKQLRTVNEQVAQGGGLIGARQDQRQQSLETLAALDNPSSTLATQERATNNARNYSLQRDEFGETQTQNQFGRQLDTAKFAADRQDANFDQGIQGAQAARDADKYSMERVKTQRELNTLPDDIENIGAKENELTGATVPAVQQFPELADYFTKVLKVPPEQVNVQLEGALRNASLYARQKLSKQGTRAEARQLMNDMIRQRQRQAAMPAQAQPDPRQAAQQRIPTGG